MLMKLTLDCRKKWLQRFDGNLNGRLFTKDLRENRNENPETNLLERMFDIRRKTSFRTSRIRFCDVTFYENLKLLLMMSLMF